MRSNKRRLLAWTLLIIALVVILLYPTARDYLDAVSLLSRLSDPNAKGLITNYGVHAVETQDDSFEVNGQRVPSRVYRPIGIGSAPGIVVVHGMHELGLNEPRLVALARALAASGFFVMTPQLQGIADYKVEPESIDVIGTAAQTFAQQLAVPKVGVVAISFSGGLALLAAADPRYSEHIAWIASLGAHDDLARVLRFYATGEADRPDGTFQHLVPHEYGPLIIVCERPELFFAQQDIAKASEALKLHIADEDAKSKELTRLMTPADQQVMQRIYDKQLDSFKHAILLRLEQNRQEDRRELATASPAGKLGSIHAPVLLLHGSDDSVIPPTELLWLKNDVPSKYLVDALISPAITHVEVGHGPSLREKLALVHWIALLFREARNAPTAQSPLPAGTWLGYGAMN